MAIEIANTAAAADALNRKPGRRSFLAAALGGLTVPFLIPDVGRVFGLKAASTPAPLNAYVSIGADGSVTLLFGGSEMGQGIKTGLAQILAEELMVDWTQVQVQQSPVDPTITYLTGGSNAVSGRYDSLRIAGAAAREMLISAAMQITGDTNRANYSAASAVVIYNGTSTPQTWAYASLSGVAATLTPPVDPPLTNPADFRLIGKPIQRVDIPSKVDGSAKFGIDIWFPGMVFAAIKHCPTLGGTLASTPSKPSGAIAVVACKASDTRGSVAAGSVNAVAVVATNTWLAKRMASSLSVSWTLPAATASVDSTQLAAQASSLLTTGAALIAEPAVPSGYTASSYAAAVEPVVNAALGTPTVDATYTVPFLAHATMEVLNCTVRLTWDTTQKIVTLCEIWAPTQAASWVAATAATLINAAQATPIASAAIIVNTTYLGGGLGRKIEQDYTSQAVQVALAVKKPVKLTWMREEDMAHDNYRPMAAVRVQATLGSGAITAWSVRNVSPAILGQRGWMAPGSVDSQAVEGAVKLPYNRGTFLTEWVPLPAGVPIGFWRSVGSSINTFAVECTIDELAQNAGQDPFTFRYSLIGDDRRKAVLHASDDMSTWRNSLPAGHAWGLAMAEWNGTIVCQVAEVSQPAAGTLRVHRVCCAVDCGQVINPNQAEAQMQGGIVHGLNAAMWGRITLTNGKVNEINFNKYRMIRLGEMPQITVRLVPSPNPPSGLGEPAVPPIAPALANGYSRLTGKRIRSLPFFPGATMGGL
ncbi:MAG TPA: molybdopterin cofactor-binding domain-containing protein [Bryobacteraceae bacterium]|nr:molybdopterin cofactor-binding domain-containing protein [Bryobacteraceae bacterium]